MSSTKKNNLEPIQKEISPLLIIENLSVKKSGKTILDNINISFYPNEITALIGPNAAGKTTLLRCIAQRIRNYSGSIKYLNTDILFDRTLALSKISYVPQDYAFFEEFTVNENLSFACEIMNINMNKEKRINEIVNLFKLKKVRHVKAKDLSGGYKRLLNIAISAVTQPTIMLLDEPTANLDINIRKIINQAIVDMKTNGISSILTSHHLEDIQEIADRLVIMNNGKIMNDNKTENIINTIGGNYRILITCNNQETVNLIIAKLTKDDLFCVKKTSKNKPILWLECKPHNFSDAIAWINDLINKSGNKLITNIDITGPSINNVFLSLFDSEEGTNA